MSAPQRGLSFRTARAAVDDAAACAQLDPSPAVLDAAAQLLCSWWAAAAGHGVSVAQLRAVGSLAATALDALVAVDAERRRP